MLIQRGLDKLKTSKQTPKTGSIISVVGKTTIEIIELFDYRQKVTDEL